MVLRRRPRGACQTSPERRGHCTARRPPARAVEALSTASSGWTNTGGPAWTCKGYSPSRRLLARFADPGLAYLGQRGVVPVISGGFEFAALVVASVSITGFLKEMLIIRLIKTLAGRDALTSSQRAEMCARLTAALRTGPISDEYDPCPSRERCQSSGRSRHLCQEVRGITRATGPRRSRAR